MKRNLEKGLRIIKRIDMGLWVIIACIIAYIFSYESESKIVSQIKQNPAAVKGIITSTGMGRNPKYRYKYKVEGITYFGHGTPTDGLRVGDSVWVVYNKQDHSKSFMISTK